MKASPPVGPGCRHIPGSEFANDTVGVRAGQKHLGIDFQPPRPGGTSTITAVVGGTVEALFTDRAPGDWSNPLYPGHTGNIVAVRDDLGRVWTYQHGRNFRVKFGQRVEAGDVLCDMWRSGRATNTHLHLGLRVNGKWTDPAKVLKELGVWPLTYNYNPTPKKEWFEMLTENDLRRIVREELARLPRNVWAYKRKGEKEDASQILVDARDASQSAAKAKG